MGNFFYNIKKTAKFFGDFYEWLQPSVCEVCEKTSSAWAVPKLVCTSCWSILFEPTHVSLIAPGIPLYSVQYYQGFWRNHLIQAKFKQNIFSYYILGQALQAFLQQPLAFTKIDAVVTIPSNPFRNFFRGGCLSTHFEEQLSQTLDIPLLSGVLTKPWLMKRQNKIQDKEERFENMHQQMHASPLVEGLHILLFDDICTTGATLKEAIRALSLYQPASITCFCLARSQLDV